MLFRIFKILLTMMLPTMVRNDMTPATIAIKAVVRCSQPWSSSEGGPGDTGVPANSPPDGR